MKVAIVGAGISGVAAAHHIQNFAETTLFEASPRIGGHTDTQNLIIDGHSYAVDTGFIVFNERNYPGFSAWLEALGVVSKPSDMSFGVNGNAGIEYGTADLPALFCQRRNLVRPRFLRMLADLRRFYREASTVGPNDPRTLDAFLKDGGYGRGFIEDHLIPMCSALWSLPRDRSFDLPVAHVVAFMANHNMLQLQGRPEWRVIERGSSRYLSEFARRFRGTLRRQTQVEKVERSADSVTIISRDHIEKFDYVVFACHSDQALALIDAKEAEQSVLGAIGYERNRVVLHSDASTMPEHRAAWSSWNVHAAPSGKCTVTYWMNRLQGLGDRHQFFVSLNPQRELTQVWMERDYAHPIFSREARVAQGRKGEINGINRTFYCGAYWGWGFHEDGFQSAMQVVQALREEVRHAA